MHHVATPVPREPGHLGEVVDHPGREDQAAAPGRATVGQVHPEAAVLADHRGDLTADDPAAVRPDLGAGTGQQLARRDTAAHPRSRRGRPKTG
ncbi:hypothetical protein J2S63_001903 [Marmoricola bigeumensis]|uniref:Uncharacterized protein n=1 Tax=Nocardioides marmoribigeumensis TaxID=433649 RepID=A0ABU2BUP7_9ACTN|nr:hypothetical protein [Nocardioides marmoribigeumensis]